MNPKSRPSKAYIAGIVVAAVGGLCLLGGLCLFIAIRRRRQKQIQSKASTETEALELEQPRFRPQRRWRSPSRSEMERRELERASRWERFVSRFGQGETGADNIEAQPRPVQPILAQSKLTQPLPARVQPTNTHLAWPGQERAAPFTQRVFRHVEQESPLNEDQTPPTTHQPPRPRPTSSKPQKSQYALPDQVQADRMPQKAFEHPEKSVNLDSQARPVQTVPLSSEQAQKRRDAQRERIFQHIDSPSRFSRQPSWRNPGSSRLTGTAAVREAGDSSR